MLLGSHFQLFFPLHPPLHWQLTDSADFGREYDSFGTPKWTIDPHDIFFISKGDGSNKVCRLGKGEYGPVRPPAAESFPSPAVTLALE